METNITCTSAKDLLTSKIDQNNLAFKLIIVNINNMTTQERLQLAQTSFMSKRRQSSLTPKYGGIIKTVRRSRHCVFHPTSNGINFNERPFQLQR